MKTNRAWALLLLAITLTGAVAGCGSSGDKPDPAKQSAQTKESFDKIPPQSRPGSGPGR